MKDLFGWKVKTIKITQELDVIKFVRFKETIQSEV